ncbi:MAG: DNA gyrase/topoisomerase IV subunit A, partial [Mucilaginibacter sp.]
ALAIKGRGSMGNIITKYPVKKIILKSKGVSTLAGRKIWYDDILKRLNADGRGKYLGEFDGDDKILTILSTGLYELTSFDLNNHFDDKMIVIEKYDPAKVYSAIHIDGKSKNYMVKRFVFDNLAIGKQTSIISDENGSKLVLISGASQPIVSVKQLKGKEQTPETIEVDLSAVIDVKGMKAMGNRLSQQVIKSVELMAEIEPEKEELSSDVEEDETDGSAEEEIIADEKADDADDTDGDVEAGNDEPDDKPVPPSPTKSVESPTEEPVKQPKKIAFEITNPDDIDIDDKGQLGLF